MHFGYHGSDLHRDWGWLRRLKVSGSGVLDILVSNVSGVQGKSSESTESSESSPPEKVQKRGTESDAVSGETALPEGREWRVCVWNIWGLPHKNTRTSSDGRCVEGWSEWPRRYLRRMSTWHASWRSGPRPS